MAQASVQKPTLYETFQIYVLDGVSERDDPLMRDYTFAPQVTKTERKLINADEDQVRAEDFDDVRALEAVYYPEVEASILKFTGAKVVFITNSIVQRGERG
ncbi:uncharacterized protein BCR38DRAFT_485972 [Pseudomassariella vexata]|uniref:Uncharacterized protein n=1 Tax=Pseudomassariella vexata TaxID=1141098 RepID=A0A1Y2DV94_9PEZI|nr:uncharacterized protein BCR38DRAFT_485972 [Pseudomassariella vexata]ORY63210.1 hypothetical protein BCR38DRAFT_485972 [Pseudomassariella vexata]